MKKCTNQSIAGLLVALVAGLATGAAFADVTMKSNISVKAGGSFKMLNSTGTQTVMVSKDRARMENTTEMESRMLNALAKNANTTSIVRIDDEILQTLYSSKQEYSEMTFAEMRQATERAMGQLSDAQSEGALPVSDDNCEWSEPDLQVTKSRSSEKFAGVKAKQTLIEASQTCTDKKTGSQCKMTWMLDYWIAKKMPGDDEVENFTRGMAKAMGGEDQLSMVKMQASGLMGMFKRGWDEVLEETGDLDGYPVKTVMSLSMGGDRCNMPSGQNISMDDVWSEAANAGVNAAAGSAASHAGSAIGREASEAVGGSVGGSIAGSAIGAASRKAISGAFSKFRKGKKKKEAEKTAQAPSEGTSGVVNLFTITTELTDIDERDLAGSNFEVPAGWKKVEGPGW